MTFKSLADEHAHFIASGYPEARWQLVLRHREVWRLKHLNPWLEDIEQDKVMLPKRTSGTSPVIKDLNTRIGVLEKMLEERPSYTSNEGKSSF